MTAKPIQIRHSVESKKPKLWRCAECGRRYRGDVRVFGHLDRSRHGVALAIRYARTAARMPDSAEIAEIRKALREKEETHD